MSDMAVRFSYLQDQDTLKEEAEWEQEEIKKMVSNSCDMQRETAVTGYFLSEQLLMVDLYSN